LACDAAVDVIRDAVDGGRFEQARELAYKIKGLSQKLKSTVQEKGGHLHFFILDRQVLEVPESVAETLPNILSDYTQELHVFVGMGMTFREAAMACRASKLSGEIEMYDATDPRFEGVSEYFKSENPFELPVNLFDVTMPENEEIEPEAGNSKGPAIPSIQEALSAEAQLVQAMAQAMQGGAPEQAQAAQQAQPRDLREALEGQQIQGYQPQQPQQAQAAQQAQQAQPAQPAEETAQAAPEEPDTGERLNGLLSQVKESLPNIMELHDKNPQAYRAAMNLIQKLVMVAKERNVQKAEEITEALNKKLELRLPVGFRRGNKRKVLVNGREVWREMSAGMVQDSHGQPISIKEANREAQNKNRG
jgi:hypothetical protein